MIRSFRTGLLGLALVMTLGHMLMPHGHTAPDKLCICADTDAGTSLIGALTRSFAHHNPGQGHLERFQQQEQDITVAVWPGDLTVSLIPALQQATRVWLPASDLVVTQPAGSLPWFRGPPVS
ncbi:MAG: hypothetical protein SF053_22345 [Bacteroidia bacterium]|nr:hypothetical protein [Bacteroidia bacterium]